MKQLISSYRTETEQALHHFKKQGIWQRKGLTDDNTGNHNHRESQTGADLAHLHLDVSSLAFVCTQTRDAVATGPPQRYLNTHEDMDQRGSNLMKARWSRLQYSTTSGQH
jgi:hypothetical protein